MSKITKKEEIRQFRRAASEGDFRRLVEKVKKGELKLSIGRDKSRRLLKRIYKKYYYFYFSSAIAWAVLTLYLVYAGRSLWAIATFGITLVIFISFWASMTRKVFAWALKEKNNFDYAYYTTVITVKKGEEEYNYPDNHWKEALN